MPIKTIVSIIAALIIGGTLLGTAYQIDERERAVLLRNGKFVAEVGPGFHFKVPFIDSIEKISIETNIVSYTFPGVYSQDQQPATIQLSVNYRLLPGSMQQIYTNYRNDEGVRLRLINPRVAEEMKTVFSQFDAETSIQQRARLNAEAHAALTESIPQSLLIIDTVQIEGVSFSAAYESSIEERMLAEVEVQRYQQNLERERVQAEILVTQATASAEQVRLQGQAEADAINARGEALRNNPDLVALVQAERWNGVLPSTMLPSGTLPIIGTNQQSARLASGD